MLLLITRYLPPYLRSGKVKLKRIEGRSGTLRSHSIEKRVRVKSILGITSSPITRTEVSVPSLLARALTLNYIWNDRTHLFTAIPFSQIVPPIPQPRHVGSLLSKIPHQLNPRQAGYAVGGRGKLRYITVLFHISRMTRGEIQNGRLPLSAIRRKMLIRH